MKFLYWPQDGATVVGTNLYQLEFSRIHRVTCCWFQSSSCVTLKHYLGKGDCVLCLH